MFFQQMKKNPFLISIGSLVAANIQISTLETLHTMLNLARNTNHFLISFMVVDIEDDLWEAKKRKWRFSTRIQLCCESFSSSGAIV